MKFVELIMYVSDFPIRGFSFSTKKSERSYVGEFTALTIGLKGLSGLCILCIFGRPYSLDGRGFVGFNVNLILLGKLLFLLESWFFARLCLLDLYQVLCMPYQKESSFFRSLTFHDYYSVAFVS